MPAPPDRLTADPLTPDPLTPDPLTPGSPVPASAHPAGLWMRLRAARYDPGGPGAAVLVAVAVAAAVLAAWFLLGSRPTAVPAPPPETRTEQPGGAAVTGPGTPGVTGGAPGVGAAGAGAVGSAPGGTEPPEVVVAVAGTVARPGVVRLPAGSRVVDAVEAAGGLLPGTDAGLLNLARVLADGEQVLVGVEPPPGAVVPGTAGAPAAPVTDAQGRIDLNRATVADLDELPGVGPVLAERIVAHREQTGRFTSVDQLREVDGIGEGRFADLQARVVVP